MALELVSTSSDLLTTQEVKDHGRITTSDEDSLIDEYVKGATKAAEVFTGRAFLTSTFKLHLNDFPELDAPIELPRPPLQSIESVKYQDTDSVEQTFSAYQSDTISEPGLIAPDPGESWPTVEDDRLGAVTIKYDAGYGDNASDVPDEIKHAVKVLTLHFYDNARTGTVVSQNVSTAVAWPRIVSDLLSHYKLRRVH